MALPASGTITMAQVATELGITSVGINLNQANVRGLAQKTSGAIAMSDLYSKSNTVVHQATFRGMDYHPYNEWAYSYNFMKFGAGSGTAPPALSGISSGINEILIQRSNHNPVEIYVTLHGRVGGSTFTMLLNGKVRVTLTNKSNVHLSGSLLVEDMDTLFGIKASHIETNWKTSPGFNFNPSLNFAWV